MVSLELVLIAPIISLVIAILGFFLIFWSFNDKPWSMKFWIIVSSFFFIPWSGFTVAMRLTDSKDASLWYLRISFISLLIALYGAYRFHHLMVYKQSDNRFETFGLAILMGINIALTMDKRFLHSVITKEGYFTDEFDPILMIPNIAFGTWATFWTFKSLNEMDAFSLFYDEEGSRNPIPILGIGALIIIAILTMVYWLVQDRSDSTPFILIISIALIFLMITYGLNPTSTILAPQRIWSFLMINSSGLPIYEHHFNKEGKSGELSLFAMAITASNTIIRNELNSKSDVNVISLENRTVLITRTDEIVFCLMADHRSIQLEILLEEAKRRIIDHPSFSTPKLGDYYGKYKFVESLISEMFSTRKLEIERRSS